MEETTQVQEQAVAKTRPGFLTVLCVLSYINNIFWLLLFFIIILSNGAIGEYLASVPVLSKFAEISKGIIGLNIFFQAMTLFSVILIWQLRKIGFYLYVFAQIVLVIITFNPLILIFTVLFIVLYLLNFKKLN